MSAVPVVPSTATVSNILPKKRYKSFLPSAKLLLDDHDWAIDTKSWRAILDASADSRQRVAQAIDNPAPMAVLLKAAATSPAALLKALGGDAGARLAVENDEAANAIIEALRKILSCPPIRGTAFQKSDRDQLRIRP